jgi:hypothetical protein
MSLDSLSHPNLVTGALLIFALCAGFVLLRGIARMVLGTMVLGASVWLAFWVWQQAPGWSNQVLGKPAGYITTGLPIVTFVVAMGLLRGLVKFIVSPFVRSGGGEPSPFTNVPLRLLCAGLAAAGLWLMGAVWVHHAGSIAELRGLVEKSADGGEVSAYLERMKAAVEAVLPKDWLKRLDPLAEPARLALAKVIAAESSKVVASGIDPATGKPYPRAVVVDDPALQGLARKKDFSTLLRHPNLTRALNDPKIKQAIADRKK